MNMNDMLEKRYSTKSFDTTKKVSAEDMKLIKKFLQYGCSSTNLQPWHFTIATSEESKTKVSRSTEGKNEFNKTKVLEASNVIVFSVKETNDEEHLLKVLNQEEKDGRFANEEKKMRSHSARQFFNNLHKYEFKDTVAWNTKQAYLNLGSLLVGLGMMEIDSVTVEGFDSEILAKELGLDKEGLIPVLILPIGYANKESDYNYGVPKSRLEESEIIKEI